MFDELDGDDLYAELIMERANDTRAFIVVEGYTDSKVLDSFVNATHYVTVPANGKLRVVRAMENVAKSRKLPFVFAILDRDWVGLLEQGLEQSTVAYTDFYDLDACIFFSPGVYERLAANFSSDFSFRQGTTGCTHQDISAACVELALPVGVLRYISQRDGLGLGLRKFPLAAVTNIRQGRVDLEALIKLACQRVQQTPEDHPGLLEALQTELAAVTDHRRFCSGHDLAKAFTLLAAHRWAANIGADTAERSARTAFGRDEFEGSGVYRNTGHWRSSTGEPAWTPRA